MKYLDRAIQCLLQSGFGWYLTGTFSRPAAASHSLVQPRKIALPLARTSNFGSTLPISTVPAIVRPRSVLWLRLTNKTCRTMLVLSGPLPTATPAPPPPTRTLTKSQSSRLTTTTTTGLVPKAPILVLSTATLPMCSKNRLGPRRMFVRCAFLTCLDITSSPRTGYGMKLVTGYVVFDIVTVIFLD